MESPSQELAKKIVARLVSEGLLSVERGRRIQNKLPSGEVKAEDWKTEIDLSTASLKAENVQ